MPSRKALVVGIDDYSFGALAGCVNDANQIAALLSVNHDGTANFDVRLLTSPSEIISRASLRAAIEELFAGEDTELALLYFSGHGTENNLGGYLVTPDATAYDEGVNLGEVLAMANLSHASERVVILDSCMSGALGTMPAMQPNSANLAEGVAVLTASRAGQVAVELGGRGLFTELVCNALEGGAADVVGDVSAPAIYSYVEEALGPWDQRPLFKAHLSRVTGLRKAQPAVPTDVLLALPTWFPDENDVFPLDPSFEDTSATPNPDNVDVFKKLQRCRDAKLVEAVDAEFMYFAAMSSTGCRLTALGRHYWKLAAEGRL